MMTCTPCSGSAFDPSSWSKEATIAVAVIIVIAAVALAALATLSFLAPYVVIPLLSGLAIPALHAIGGCSLTVSLPFGGALLYLILHRPKQESHEYETMPVIEPTEEQKEILQEVQQRLSDNPLSIPGWKVTVKIEMGQFLFMAKPTGRNGLTTSNGELIIPIPPSSTANASSMISHVQGELNKKALNPLRPQK